MFRKIVLPSLLVIVALFAISLSSTNLVHGQIIGVVCMAAPPATPTSGCPSTQANIPGGLTIGSRFVVAINIQGSDAMNGFRIFVKTDNTVINPVKADTNNTFLTNLLVLANCINNSGTGCSLSAGDGPGVVDVGVVSLGGLSNPPTTGNLFEIVYQVMATTNGTPVNFLTSATTSGTCANGSSVQGVCVTITNGGSTPDPETVQTGIAINNPSFALSATSGNLTIAAGSSKTSTITVSAVLGGTGTVTLTRAVTPVVTNGPTATLSVASGGLTRNVVSFTSLLTVSTVAATPAGNYNVTVTGVCTVASCSVTTRNLIIPVVIPGVSKASTTTSLTSSVNPSIFGQSVTFTATVAVGTGTPTGTVNFLDGATVIGSGTLSAAAPFTATFATGALSVATHSITATYLGDGNFLTSTSGAISQVVNKAGTSTGLTSSVNPSVFGQSTTFTATVAAVSPGAGTPTGTVNFLDGATVIGSGTLSATAPFTATFSTGALSVATHSITATYVGDGNFLTSTSGAVSQVVNKASTTTSLASSANPSVFGQSVTFTATVAATAPGAGTPTGTVNFLDGATVIGSGTLSATSPFTATFSTGALSVATHSITATYVGDGNFLTSTSGTVSQVVNKASTTTSLTSSVNPSVFGQSTTFTATVAAVSPGAGTPTGTVNFLDGATVIGSGTLSATAPFTASFSTGALSVAAHSITATYVGDGNFLTSTSGTVSQVVNKASTTTTLASSLNPSTFGQSITFTATIAVVSPGAGTPTGSVNFLDGTTVIGSGALSATSPFIATFSTSSLAAGTHSITATYVGDGNFLTSTSTPLSQLVNKASTNTGLTSSVNPSIFGQSVTFTATVAVVAPGAGTPAGAVNFLDGATVIGSGTLSATAPFTATFSTGTLSVATHSITAQYIGNTNFSGSTSNAVSQVVNKASTTTSLTSSVNPSVFGQSVTFTATAAVVSPGAGTPTGSVNFLDGTTVIGSGTLSATAPFTATFSTGALSVATHSITATYVGDGNFLTSTSGAVSQVVNKAGTTTSLTLSPNPSVFGQSVTLTATVAAVAPGAGTPTGTVNFLDGATVIGTGTLNAARTATFSTGALSVATHSFTATYLGDGNFLTSTSGAVSQVVNKASTTTSLTSSVNPSVFGQSVIFTATVAVVSPGAGTPTGSVNFLDGATIIGSGTLSATAPFTATFSTSGLSVATHSITATYVGDANFLTSTSGTVSQVVNKASTTTSLTSSVNPSVFGQSVTFTATVAVVSPGAGTPTGSVNFLDGATVIGSGTLSATAPFIATFSTGALSVATHSITAIYVGDGNFLTSTSGAVSQVVNKASTTTSLTSSVNPSVFGQSITFTATVAVVSPGAGTPAGTVNFLDGATMIGSGTLSATAPFVATFSTGALSVATHSITAQYIGNTNFSGSTSNAVSQVVNKASTTTSLTSSVNPSVFGQSVTFTATVAVVSPGAGTPTGSVNFLDGATIIGSGTLSATAPFTATFSTGALSVATHSITATYVGDGNFLTSTSGAVSQVVNHANTTTTVASSLNPSTFGQSVTFTATVTATAPGAGTPTGTVTFLNGTISMGTSPLSATGTATLTVTFTHSGSFSITAQYGGDASFNGSTSTALTQVVNPPGALSTTIRDSTNAAVTSVVLGTTVHDTATLSGVTATAGGNVVYAFWTTGTCTGTAVTQTVNVTNGIVPDSSPRTPSPVGLFSFNATYSGDANNPAAKSGCEVLTVTQASTTTGVTSSVNPSVFGQSVIFTATVTGSTTVATPTGTAQFKDGATVLATVSVTTTAGVTTATFTTSALAVGGHSITAVYSGDTNFTGSTSPVLTQTVNKASTTTSLTSGTNPSVFGQSVTFTATVAAVSPGAGTPTGTVNFLDGATVIGTGTLNAARTATFSTTALSVATHSITAAYQGDGSFLTSTSTAVSQIVNKASTTTGLTSSVNPSVVGQSVTFTATVAAVSPGAGTPSSTVTFFDGTTTLGTGTLSGGTATFTTSTLAQGPHSITAQYGGDGNFNGSTSTALTQTVGPPVGTDTTTTVTSSVNPSCFGQSVTFTATVAPVTGTGTPTGTVTFLDGMVTLGTGTLSSGIATFTTAALSTGSHSITASYGGDTNFNVSTSTALTQVVNKCGTTVTLASSANPSVFGQSVTFTATVTVVAPGVGTPTGTVNFLDGVTVIGSGTLSATAPFTATFATSGLAVGTHSITATYLGDGNFFTSTSTAVSQVVNKASTTTSLTSSVNPSVFGQSTTFTATVAALSPGAGTPTGTVNFLDGATMIGTGALSGGVATFSTGALSVATHSITATYVGDGNFLTSTSGAVSQVVNKASTSTIVTSSPNPSAVGQPVTFTATVTVTAPGAGTPTGTVTFLNGTISMGTSPLSATGTATLTVTFTHSGSFSITAQYSGDGSFNGSTSTALTQIVNAGTVSFFGGKLSWTHHLSLAKTANLEIWTAKITNSNSFTVYAQITIIGVDGTGTAGFTAQSAVITMAAGASLTPTITQTFSSTDIGVRFHFTGTILWGTSPTALTNPGGNTKSGSFAVVA